MAAFVFEVPCYHPLKGWPSRTVNPSGKRSLTFSEAHGFGSPVEVACGQCIGCRLERARQWSVRITDEAQLYDENCFLTVTYADEHLPHGGSLDRPAYQRFLKRLRARLVPKRVRFFGCGEYGDLTERPHYHFVLLGHAFLADRVHVKTNNGHRIYTSKLLDDVWGLGNCWIGSVTTDSAGYVARYCTKKVTGDQAKVEAHYRGRTPEFMTCSQGIGREFFERYKSDMYPSDHKVFKGKPMRVPRYYDKQLPEETLAVLKQQRMERALERADNNTPQRLKVRETVAEARLLTFSKREL